MVAFHVDCLPLMCLCCLAIFSSGFFLTEFGVKTRLSDFPQPPLLCFFHVHARAAANLR